MSPMPDLLPIWQRAHATFPGLTQFDLPPDRDRYISATLAAVLRGLERDVSAEAAEMFRETGAARARTRQVLRRMIPQLREARALIWAVIRARAATPTLMAAE